MNTVVVWFKKDLRVDDHAPLFEACQSGSAVIPLYVVETEYWEQPYASKRQWQFIHDCLIELNKSLTELGQPLIVKVADNAHSALNDLAKTCPYHTLYVHEETGNRWTYQRDIQVYDFCKKNKIELREFPHNGIVRRLSSRDHWQTIRLSRLKTPLIGKPHRIKSGRLIESDPLPHCDADYFRDITTTTIQAGGQQKAWQTLHSFLHLRCQAYLYNISKPQQSETHCSRLSAFLANGVLSTKQVFHAVDEYLASLEPTARKKVARSLSAFKSRLSWRDHFIQKLEDQPNIETRCMHPYFENMRPVPGNSQWLDAWKTGHTGYPLIDACMRSLNQKGWITFRMRAMLVSFASYHLWLDWRETGKHLAAVFTDYEPGIHYSQLQMQSGTTGINALRMYNPIKQSQEHDPDGAFIKKWIPELRPVSSQYIHTPWEIPPLLQQEINFSMGKDYPYPIVDHTEAIRHARAEIAKVRKKFNFSTEANAVFKKLGSRKKKPSQKKTAHKPGTETGQIAMDLDDL
jgi:deoxyribodipyrimidine photo-lyase